MRFYAFYFEMPRHFFAPPDIFVFCDVFRQPLMLIRFAAATLISFARRAPPPPSLFSMRPKMPDAFVAAMLPPFRHL